MTKRKRPSTDKDYQQLYDGNWYLIEDYYTHVCCDCGLAHRVWYKLENGRVFMRWDRDPKETAAARRIMKREHESDDNH